MITEDGRGNESDKSEMACVPDSDMSFRHLFLFTAFNIDWDQHVLSVVINQHIS